MRVASGYPERSIRDNQQFVSELNFLSPRRKDAVVIPLALDRTFGSLEKATVACMKDGTMAFEVVENRARKGYIMARTRWGGAVRGDKAVNVPGLRRSAAVGRRSVDQSLKCEV
jgi:hypothetical protein